ncbi:ribosomal protein S12 methylthiotransferase accessory factor [Actinokineospora baliensis]|uniref:YcaO-like family protein n=1 Tax=Actinokineospora baliensis TaxID=547056 RepID=UPI00195AF855|nr:YcaO-like family protein [Actinokineospora baliensis]MBM7771844.1 ribosomal protein S12 methylthiotransferase accessory factor [Actinokineospora baliensis]
MTSSLRVAPLAETLAAAREVAPRWGITRVTDTTWLDRIGIPVFAGIRPTAVAGSLCVTAGKGVRAAEAEVGAVMEAIEYAHAEYGASRVRAFASTPHAVANQPGAAFDFVDLCPVVGRPVDPHGPLDCVTAHEITDGTELALPAELVFSPYRHNDGQRLFGSNTTGLASGNTVTEATLHGLAEVVERDIGSFEQVRGGSRLVEVDTPPPQLRELVDKIDAAGLRLALRHTPNEFDLPYFTAAVLEPDDAAPIAIAYGVGLHPLRDIAAVRAVCEAAQSRLTSIHGGRDDLVNRIRYFAAEGTEELAAVAALRAKLTDDAGAVLFSDIAPGRAPSVESTLDDLLDMLRRKGFPHVYRVVLSEPDSPLAVVRVIVPGMESFDPGLPRVGPRLAGAR